ncbi:MAG: methylated-DNA--[protein]-cysteine S-methyltransferase [Candidatus Cloacimonetes bacterium]|nr:methylated-DNA--[protein]-cysteine S-methyltransferase [Candidatus Cloacimonadota bacterium]
MRAPFGDLCLVSDGNHLLEIRFGRCDIKADSDLPILTETEKQLSQYFQGKRQKFEIPLAPAGTMFQRNVWCELEKIEYGATISYQMLAERTGNNKRSRAVGNANGKNPIPIIIPCHRVIRKNGDLGGYAGGLKIKKTLLKLEKRK